MPDSVINSNVKYRRLIYDSKIDNICDILSQSHWSELYNIEDVHLCYDELLCTFSAIYNTSFLIEQVKIKMHHNVLMPWITHGIVIYIYINNKHRLYK